MKINYHFNNGENSEVEVSEELGAVILESRRKEENLARKERYHCVSMENSEFEGVDFIDETTPEIETFAGKLVENIIQAIARDILCFAMNTLSKYRIVATVHDEIIIECPQDTSLEFICKQMSITPPWADGLVLNADGDEMMYYQKS